MVEIWKNIAGNLELELQKHLESRNIWPDKIYCYPRKRSLFSFIFMMLLCKHKSRINFKFKAHKPATFHFWAEVYLTQSSLAISKL